MKSIRNNFSGAGYNLEEAYFFLKDKELIEKLKESSTKAKILQFERSHKPKEIQERIPEKDQKAA